MEPFYIEEFSVQEVDQLLDDTNRGISHYIGEYHYEILWICHQYKYGHSDTC